MDEENKYTRIEYERRFLVRADSGWENYAESNSKLFEDFYLSNTRLRLRVLSDSDSDRVLIKLTKKEASDSPYFRRISRILLSKDEYHRFSQLDGDGISKVRYYCELRGRVFSVDVFQGELSGLILSEVESEDLDDLMSIELPAFATCEVTEDQFFDGVNLSKTSKAELIAKLGSFNCVNR